MSGDCDLRTGSTLCRFGDGSTSCDEPQHDTELKAAHTKVRMEAWAKSARKDMDRSGFTSQRKESSCSKRTVAGWGQRAQCQTKSVCHSARDGPIARILLGGEKVPEPIGGLFLRPRKRESGEEWKGGALSRIPVRRPARFVGTTKVNPPRRVVLDFTDLLMEVRKLFGAKQSCGRPPHSNQIIPKAFKTLSGVIG